MKRARSLTLPAARRSLARLLVALGILMVGYAPFLHAFNALYYVGVHAGKSVGSIWLSWGFTMNVPLLGFAFLEAAATLWREHHGSRRAIEGDHVGFARVSALFAAACVVSGLRDVLAPEIYADRFGEGVFFAKPWARDLVSPALLAALALAVAVVAARFAANRGSEDTVSETPFDRSQAGSGSEGESLTPRVAPCWVRIALVACWGAPLLTIPSMGGEVHFDVPTRFVHVVEAVLAARLCADWIERRSVTLTASALTAVVLADLAATLLAPSGLPLLYGRGVQWILYERLQFHHGRYVNGVMSAVGAVALTAVAVTASRQAYRGRWLGQAQAPGRSSPQPRARSRSAWLLRAFLLASIGWFVVSMSAWTLVWLNDLVFGVDGTALWSNARPRLASQAIPVIELLASWLAVVASAHLMVSTTLRLDASLSAATATDRSASDRRAWLAFFAASAAIASAALVRVAWLGIAAMRAH